MYVVAGWVGVLHVQAPGFCIMIDLLNLFKLELDIQLLQS
jgi:hypothetical protein